MKKADAIWCGDIHLRETIPICRTEKEFNLSQWNKLQFIKDLQKEHDCPVGCAGDFYDWWKPSPWLLTQTMKYIPAQFNTIYGDHDMPQHSFKLRLKSGLKTLQKAGALKIVHGGHGTDKYSKKLPSRKPSMVIKGRKMLLWHIMTWKNELPFPGCDASNAKSLLEAYPQFDIIVTGDNHKPFTVKYKDRLLVNVGSMMRQTAAQIDYKPAVWLYYADTNTVKKVYLPIVEDAVSREHLEKEQMHNDRIDAFVGAFQTIERPSMNFEQNVLEFMSKNRIHKSIKNIIKIKMKEHD